MFFAKMQNEALDPVRISLLGTDTVMLQANFSPDLIEQLGFLVKYIF